MTLKTRHVMRDVLPDFVKRLTAPCQWREQRAAIVLHDAFPDHVESEKVARVEVDNEDPHT